MRLFCKGCQKVFEAEKPLDSDSVKCPVCGAEQHYPEVIPGPGVVVGDFLIEKLLSRGGMGEVFLAKQISLDRPVALKVLQQKHLNDREYVDSLFKEARAAAKLNHPNIVQAYAVGEDNGIFYFAMEFIRGETFKQILKREKTIDFPRAATVIRDIARALDAAWREQKLVHQDIKPDNIMLDANGFAKLADLGLAKIATGSEDTVDDGDEVLGTPQYISPEQLTGVPTDIRSDIYSLGATFYHFVTGRFPYVADTGDEIAKMHVEGKLQPPKEVNPALPEALNKIILKMMARDINERYQGAAPLIRALDMYLRTASESGSAAIPKLNIKGRGKPEASAVKVPAAPKVPDPPKIPAVPRVAIPSAPPRVPGTPPPASPVAPKAQPPTSPERPAVAAVPEKPESAPPDYDAEERRERIRRTVKICSVVIGSVGLLAAISAAALVICHKYGVLPDVLKPAGQYLAGWFVPGNVAVPRQTGGKADNAARQLPPPAKTVETRPEYVREIVNIIRIIDESPDNAGKFLLAADKFFAADKQPLTPREREEYARLAAAFAPQDEKLRFEPFRRKARETHLAALAESERARERERLEQERLEREEAERREREAERLESERRRIQEERRRQDSERTEKLQKDIRGVLKQMVEGFYAAVDGDRGKFDASLDAAAAVFIPAGSTTPEEQKMITLFNAFRKELPGELKKLQEFRRSVTDMPEGFSYPAPKIGVVQVVSLLPDGGIVYRGRNGSRAQLPTLDAAARRRLMLVLARYAGNRRALFYYGLMTRHFDREMRNNVPSGFWKNGIGIFAELATKGK